MARYLTLLERDGEALELLTRSSENVENGLLGRLLVAMPPTPRAHWSDADVALARSIDEDVPQS